jgi:hypothetical protein
MTIYSLNSFFDDIYENTIEMLAKNLERENQRPPDALLKRHPKV